MQHENGAGADRARMSRFEKLCSGGGSMRTLASFKDIHRAEAIVVCGCGSSLNNFKQPERFITIGVNDVGRLFQPKYLLVVDPKQAFKGDRFRYVEASQAEYLFTQLPDLGLSHPNVVVFRLGKKDGTDLSDPNVLPYSVISPYVALCLAAHMGARRIGVIGVDFTPNHFFGSTGNHAWAPYLAAIDEQFRRLGSALQAQGVKVLNLSPGSRVTAFPKMSLQEFGAMTQPQPVPRDLQGEHLRIASYATTPLAGIPAILARCINFRSSHYSRCIWAHNGYSNGVVFRSDINWNESPTAASAELSAADVVIVHNGQVIEQHKSLLAAKPVVTMAPNQILNGDHDFVRQGFPGAVVGQYQATLPEFRGWSGGPQPGAL